MTAVLAPAGGGAVPADVFPGFAGASGDSVMVFLWGHVCVEKIV